MINSSNNIYTIQTDVRSDAQVIQIETLITKGLYRFTLLGMGQKHSSDTKDRVYSALRSSNLLNLKSDNRKIIVNLFPDNVVKNENLYDLGIAISCAMCTGKIYFNRNLLIVGELSITGNILPTKRLFQSIYTAYIMNISNIVCSSDDVLSLNNEHLNKLSLYGINIIHSNTLKDIFLKLQIIKEETNTVDFEEKESSINNEKSDTLYLENPEDTYLDKMNTVHVALYIGLVGAHRICIETQNIRDFKKQYEMFYLYNPKNKIGKEIYRKYRDKSTDDSIYKDIVFIENLKDSDITKYYYHDDSVIALYQPCTCGYSYTFFSNNSDRRCICSKRNIIQYKRSVEDKYFPYFSMNINNIQKNQSTSKKEKFDEKSFITTIHKKVDTLRQIQFERYVIKNSLSSKDVFMFPDNRYLNEYADLSNILDNLDYQALEIWNSSDKDERCLRVAQTIQDIFELEIYYKNNNIINIEKITKIKPAISKQALLLALSYIPKMDF